MAYVGAIEVGVSGGGVSILLDGTGEADLNESPLESKLHTLRVRRRRASPHVAADGAGVGILVIGYGSMLKPHPRVTTASSSPTGPAPRACGTGTAPRPDLRGEAAVAAA
jgi:hypothetical protein